MEQFDRLFSVATAQIGPHFFELPIAGQNAAYRERVYCYELYHQMRSNWPQGPYTLNGEVDKSGHRKLREMQADRYKPDLLVHVPGDMNGNFAVIEVKPCNAAARGLRKDLQTLKLFSREVAYPRAVYLIYGFRADAAATRIHKELAGEHFPQLEIWVHREPGSPAIKLGTS
ncbi:hypothetical protein [Variovorax paradoxus]|uniref:hypothetical protein n=1 Tax=Variovorax paradoxus TaxID=34073 RepID=UPI003D65744E